jgi:hypothetical protein
MDIVVDEMFFFKSYRNCEEKENKRVWNDTVIIYDSTKHFPCVKTEGDKYSQQTWHFVSTMISKTLNSIAHIYYFKMRKVPAYIMIFMYTLLKSQIKIKIMKYLTSLWTECEQKQNV